MRSFTQNMKNAGYLTIFAGRGTFTEIAGRLATLHTIPITKFTSVYYLILIINAVTS
jgi:hypothetical protein